MKRRTRALLLSGCILTIVSASVLFWVLWTPAVAGDSSETHVVKISRGMSFNGIISAMAEDGILTSVGKVRTAGFILRLRDEMKAGKYEIHGGLSSWDLLTKLSAGRVAIDRVTIPEGKTAHQIASIVQDAIEIDSSRFVDLVKDSAFISSLDLEVTSLEGFLFPDTYGFYWGMTPKSVIRTMVNQFKREFADTLRSRLEELDITMTEILTLASIIEGEAVIDEERDVISAVYWNRLEKNMLLQADPTIQYIIPDGPRRLLKRDLAIDSPYNTYKYRGLPPGPINNPGIASIRAALFPADVEYLYFVANGDGSHTFSRSLREHLKAKARFDRIRKETARKKQAEG